MRAFGILDQKLARLPRALLLGIAVSGTAVLGFVDYVTGYEISISLFYAAPVALVAWYAGRRSAIGIAFLSCVAWYLSDTLSGHEYSHPIIPVWNALVRLGFFLLTGLLLAALHRLLSIERRLARTDDLTGVFSRRAFEERLKHDLQLAHRERRPLTLVYLDVDNFKFLNDTWGHAEGDRVLRLTGEVLRQNIRRTDTVARLGGDEFALLLPFTDGRHAQDLVSKLMQRLRQAFATGHAGVTYSVGVVTFARPPLVLEKAVTAAEKLMYKVKRQGKGAIAFSEQGDAEPVYDN